VDRYPPAIPIVHWRQGLFGGKKVAHVNRRVCVRPITGRSAAIYDTLKTGAADSRSLMGIRMSDDEIDEMIRTAIYLHVDDAHRVMALEWLDERVAVYHAYKSDVNLTPRYRRAMTARSA
jgi:hypothetical protein